MGGIFTAGGDAIHWCSRLASEGPMLANSVSDRPAATTSTASSGHMKAACAARRKPFAMALGRLGFADEQLGDRGIIEHNGILY